MDINNLRKFIVELFVSHNGPHNTIIEEILRVADPRQKRDAVLFVDGGPRTFSLAIVRRGKSVHSADKLVHMIHCDEAVGLSLLWISPHRILITGKWDAISTQSPDAIEREAAGEIELDVRKL